MSELCEQVELYLPMFGRKGRVRINGKEWKSVRRIKIESAPDAPTVVTLEFVAHVTGSTFEKPFTQ